MFGAGAFGGWTALELVRRGARVTLLDAWGPGNARASSGGETRVMRATYGTRTFYAGMAARALELWRAHDVKSGRPFFRRTGVLWLLGCDDGVKFVRASADALREQGLPLQEMTPAAAVRAYPQISFSGITSVFFEPNAGYLLARRACEHVLECVIGEGGEYRPGAAAVPAGLESAPLKSVALADGGRIDADCFVFACGPWLPNLFPDVVGELIKPTRQDVYYFGTPPDDRFSEACLPIWIDFRDRLVYGIPGNANRGFKVADDTPGPFFDPTDGDRNVGGAGVSDARAFLGERFPALAGAPLIGSEVCQYESTPDSNFIVDRHPAADNVWIAGGGSGHGYKMGPVIGEMLASLILDEREPDPLFALRRFAATPREGWRQKWS